MVDRLELKQYKTLANEAIIDCFGQESPTQRLAEALEKCVEELQERFNCGYCRPCEDHDEIE